MLRVEHSDRARLSAQSAVGSLVILIYPATQFFPSWLIVIGMALVFGVATLIWLTRSCLMEIVDDGTLRLKTMLFRTIDVDLSSLEA